MSFLPVSVESAQPHSHTSVGEKLHQIADSRSPASAVLPDVGDQIPELGGLGELEFLLFNLGALQVGCRILKRNSFVLFVFLDPGLNHLLQGSDRVVVIEGITKAKA